VEAELVSIVIVAHNNWPELELAIESALHQSYRPVEVIVVDNGSSDGTAGHVARRFRDAIHYIQQDNRFDSGGRNAGFRVASGEFIQFLDGDDLLAPNKIEKQVELFRSDAEVDIVYGDYRCFLAPAGQAHWEETDARDHADILATLVDPRGNGADLLVHSALLRRRALVRIGEWDEDISGSDQEFWLRAAWVGCCFRHCPGSLCFYRRSPRQFSSDESRVRRALEMTWSKALGYVTTEPYRGQIARRLARLRFFHALSGDGLTRREAVARLALARATCPAAVPTMMYAGGRILIAFPAVGALLRSRMLGSPRRGLMRFFGTEC
jgi:glycosyltransferase involved in cell wall biosynthesis